MSTSYDNWDPMKGDYFSFGNLLRFQRDDPGSLLSGQTLNSRVDVCPFSGPGNVCYKGDRCTYKYHVNMKDVKANPKIGVIGAKERILCLSHLPPKPMGREGMMNTGIVVAVVNPGEFYIVPRRSWECACKEEHDKDANSETTHCSDDGESPTNANPNAGGIEALNDMFQAMSIHIQPNERNHVDSYATNELVAVRLGTTTPDEDDKKPPRKLWFRAVAVEDVTLGDDMECPQVLLRLLDFGVYVIKSVLDIVRLPKLFCHVPPLAYKCSLFGISPLTHKWSRAAIETFKILTEFQPCVFDVRRTIQLDDDGPPDLFEKNPYLLDVNVKLDNVYYNAAHALASEGLGIPWNLTPGRPLVSATLHGELWHLLEAENNSNAKESMKCNNKKIKSDNPHQNVIIREIKRMNKLLARLNINTNNDNDSDTEWNSQNSSVNNSVDDLLRANQLGKSSIANKPPKL